jgi:predicted ATPase
MTTPEQASEVLVQSSSYDFTPHLLRSPQRVVDSTPLDERGANLVAVLRSVLNGLDGDTLRQSLRALVDGVQDVEVQALGGHLVAELVYGTGGDGAAEQVRFDLGLESDGTIRLLAILAALYQSPPRTLTVIEEPERNIHPGALGVLADVIKEASTRGQVLITTHSPDLIDKFDADDIRVVERVDGATVVGRMDRTQREVVREKLFTTGELMRVQGLIRDEDG